MPLPTSSPGTRAPRTFAPTPFDEGAVHHVETVRAFVDAYDAGRYDDAIAFIDERILFSGDCDYGSQKLYSISDHESATYWLRSRIADHDRIDIVQFVDLQDGESSIGVDISRSSDTIRERGYGAAVRPRVPLFVRFSLDGRRIIQLAFKWSAPVGTFSDCLP
ncbi:MAG TPA: hypothetical protein VIN70_07985 [Candidatus Limnocylindria bacterium]